MVEDLGILSEKSSHPVSNAEETFKIGKLTTSQLIGSLT